MRYRVSLLLMLGLLTTPLERAAAQRVLTDPATQVTSQATVDFETFTVVENGSGGLDVFSTALFSASFDDESPADSPVNFVYSFPLPSDLSTTVTPQQISELPGFVSDYGTSGSLAVAPGGQFVVASHSAGTGDEDTVNDTLHSILADGTDFSGFSSSFRGVFSGAGSTGTNNLVDGGTDSVDPVFRGTGAGTTLFFRNFNPTPGGGENEVLYSVGFNPTTGLATGTPTALSTLTDDVSSSFAISADGAAAVYSPTNADDTLVTVNTATGVATTVPITASPVATFDIDSRVAFSPDGNTIFFIGDYEVAGRSELFSVPASGGLPTRVSNDLPSGADVTNFEVSPDGQSVVYAANAEDLNTNELFFRELGNAANSAVQISFEPDQPGAGDVSREGGRGVIQFSPDGSQVFYLGDQTTNEANDLYVVDTTARGTITDSTYNFTGGTADFHTATNWQTAAGDNPATFAVGTDSVTDIEVSLVIDGAATVVNSGSLDIGENGSGSLSLTGGATLNVGSGSSEDFDIDPDASLTITDSTLTVADNVFLGGEVTLTNATINSGDDIDFQAGAEVTVTGGTLNAVDFVEFFGEATLTNVTIISTEDDIEFEEGSAVQLTGGSLTSTSAGGTVEFQGFDPGSSITGVAITTSRLSIESGVDNPDGSSDGGTAPDVVATDTSFVINGPANDADGSDAGSLTLLGDSSFSAENLEEGFDLLLDGETDATLTQVVISVDDGTGTETMVDVDSAFLGDAGLDGMGASVTLLSDDASLTVSNLDTFDALVGGLNPSDFIFNPDGLSLATNPELFDVMALAGGELLITLVADGLAGDFNNDDVVNAADFVVFRDGAAAGGTFADFAATFGEGSSSVSATAAVPEPGGAALVLLAAFGLAARRRGVRAA